MNVRKLEMRRFMSHVQSQLDIPPRGLIVVTGENGSGKSSLIEGVAWSGWGKTLRGVNPWPAEPVPGISNASSNINVEGLFISRSRDLEHDKTGLCWQTVDDGTRLGKAYQSIEMLSGTGKIDYETTTKAQQALERFLGSFDVWRRAHVFLSAETAHFTLATDGERKRLMESFLGIDVFDAALAKCRTEMGLFEKRVDQGSKEVERWTANADAEKRTLEAAQQSLERLGELMTAANSGQSVDALARLHREAEAEVRVTRAKLRNLQQAGAEHVVAARNASTLLERIKADRCPTCTQDIPDALRTTIRAQVTDANAAAEKAQNEAAGDLSDCEASLDELEEELAVLGRKLAERRAAERTNASNAKERERYDALVTKAKADIHELLHQVIVREEELDGVREEYALLLQVEKVLGLRGVRAHILARSLGGLEAVANAWLARLRGGLRIALPYAQNDTIPIEIYGAGGGYGYKVASGGERRRVDVALTLGLAELKSAAGGLDHGTLFFDEVFDCLDEQGTDAVADTLLELSQTRSAVVVITHSVLAERLRGSMGVTHLNVVGGVLNVVN